MHVFVCVRAYNYMYVLGHTYVCVHTCVFVCACVCAYMHVFKHHVLLIYFLIISFTRPDPSGYHYRWLPVEICCYPSMN